MFIASALASACVIHEDVISAGANTQQVTLGISEKERPAGGITMPTISECIPAMPWEHEPEQTQEQQSAPVPKRWSAIWSW